LTAPNYVTDKIRGYDYTEDATPYSSLFRPKTPVPFTYLDEINLGGNNEMPSSTCIFYKWYTEVTGSQPSQYTVAFWAALDILEKVLYAAATTCSDIGSEGITREEIYKLLTVAQCSTPFGRVSFDSNRINFN
jgi:hypothetical protein